MFDLICRTLTICLFFVVDFLQLVDDFFKKLRDLNKSLHNNIFVTIKRMLEVSKSFPEQLVSALRIIEREEMFVFLDRIKHLISLMIII